MADTALHRRRFLTGLAGSALCSPALLAAAGDARAMTAVSLEPARPFSFDALVEEARQAASEPYMPVKTPPAAILDRLDYDAHWQIAFDPERSIDVGAEPMQLFHLGKYAREPVSVHLVADGQSRELRYNASLFTMPADSPARALDEDAGFAGLRFMRPGIQPDWISFLGASYFRCDGPQAQYGLSARGLAIDTGLSVAEEFPRFSAFYVSAPERRGEDVVIYARLDSQRVTGAYRIGARRFDSGPQHCDIEATLFFRDGVERLGVAPLTSMFWYSELNRSEGTDWRPEIHDSDGLALHMSTGERIWRPLRNPARVTTSSFLDAGVKGFGLAQRDRAFANYQDDGVFYNKRPTAWIVPRGDWGPGAVQLVEIPTDDETFDNIVAYWTPRTQPAAGSALSFDYTLKWRATDPEPDPVARAVHTFRGHGGVAGQSRPEGLRKYVIDFEGDALTKAGEEVELSVDASAGEILRPSIRPVVGQNRWRAIFDLEGAHEKPIELRAYLHRGGRPLTETWSFLAEG